MKRFNHAFAVGFSVDSDAQGDAVPADELLAALEARVRELRADRRRGGDEIVEACGLPVETITRDHG